MKLHEQLFWKVRNFVQAHYLQWTRQGTGLLDHREDPRDLEADLGFFSGKPIRKVSLHNGKIYNQSPFNNCVFASRAMGAGCQQGIEWSVRWDCIVARRMKWLTGNGWSYLRAENDLGVKIGRLPEYILPSTINGRRWDEYSLLPEKEYQRLLKIAEQYKVSEYRRVLTPRAALTALEKGYVLFTALKWYSGDNNPVRNDYILKFQGSFLGGHAHYVSGFDPETSLHENPQTFGYNYGKDGVVFLDKLFGSNFYDIYIEEFLPLDVRVQAFTEQYEQKMVRSDDDPRCFVITGGQKRWVSGEDNMRTFFALEKAGGLTFVQSELLSAVPEGSPYPLIT